LKGVERRGGEKRVGKIDDVDDLLLVREMGITRVLPRTSGMSTSDLIKRVQAYAGAIENKQQQEWDKEKKK
jgi:hypothetical protein